MLHYCNALFIGIPGRSLHKLQYILNNAARILMRERKRHHTPLILAPLHWLPISFRIEFKTPLLTFQCMESHGNAPPDLKLLSLYNPIRTLWSSNSLLLHAPRTKHFSKGELGFQLDRPHPLECSPRPPEGSTDSLGRFLLIAGLLGVLVPCSVSCVPCVSCPVYAL